MVCGIFLISLESNFPFAEKLPDGISIQKREGDGEVYYFFMNFNSIEQSVLLKETIVLKDIESGEQLEGNKICLQPLQVRIFCSK